MHQKETENSEENKQVYAFQNDILALHKTFSLPDINYKDISQQERLSAAIKRWPLLAELAQHR